MFKDDLDKFEEQEIKKIRLVLRNWFDQLIKQNLIQNKPKIIRDKLQEDRKNKDEYLYKIESYLRNMIIICQNSNAWKIQLTIAVNFISSKDIEEKHIMYSSSDNIKVAPYSVKMMLLKNFLSQMTFKKYFRSRFPRFDPS